MNQFIEKPGGDRCPLGFLYSTLYWVEERLSPILRLLMQELKLGEVACYGEATWQRLVAKSRSVTRGNDRWSRGCSTMLSGRMYLDNYSLLAYNQTTQDNTELRDQGSSYHRFTIFSVCIWVY